MRSAREIIHIPDDSPMARLLDDASDAPVQIERHGVMYRLTRDDDPWAGYDPEVARAGMASAAGTLTPSEASALKAHIYRARDEGTRPADRP